MCVVLQRDREAVGVRGVRRPSLVCRRPGQRDMIVHQNAVVQDGHRRRPDELAVRAEARRSESDVETLPCARRTRGVHQRRELSIDRRGLPIGVGPIPVGIEHLHLVEPHQKHAAVATILPLSARRARARPFHMELHVPESLSRLDSAGTGQDLEVALAHQPGRGCAGGIPPLVEARAVEEHDRVTGRRERERSRAWVDHRRCGTIQRVLGPVGGLLRAHGPFRRGDDADGEHGGKAYKG